MAMHCERDLERRKELESIEQRSRRLKALVEEWTNAIDEVREDPFLKEGRILEFEKTLRMPETTPKRSH
jgi:hypothetical protein